MMGTKCFVWRVTCQLLDCVQKEEEEEKKKAVFCGIDTGTPSTVAPLPPTCQTGTVKEIASAHPAVPRWDAVLQHRHENTAHTRALSLSGFQET